MEECIVVNHVSLQFGDAAAKLVLYQAFRVFGSVLSIELSGSSAIIMFSSSASAQQAYLEMNGFAMFDSEISVCIGEKIIAPGVSCSALSSSPTPIVLCEGADASWVSIVLRRLRGVVHVEAISSRQCFVRLEDACIGEAALNILDGVSHPTGRVVVAHFLRASHRPC